MIVAQAQVKGQTYECGRMGGSAYQQEAGKGLLIRTWYTLETACLDQGRYLRQLGKVPLHRICATDLVRGHLLSIISATKVYPMYTSFSRWLGRFFHLEDQQADLGMIPLSVAICVNADGSRQLDIERSFPQPQVMLDYFQEGRWNRKQYSPIGHHQVGGSKICHLTLRRDMKGQEPVSKDPTVPLSALLTEDS